MQVKLLRVLQEGQFRPVGSNRIRNVNVRVIASTNRDLGEEVERGNFREDLYYRINIFQITPPPLRERKEDILALATHFLEKYARKNNRQVPILAPQALDMLVQYGWPGNVRQLENEMERAVTMAAGKKTIVHDFLSDRIKHNYNENLVEDHQDLGELKEMVRRLEVRLITEALQTTGGNQTKAANILGLSRQGLINKMKAYSV